jgi:hypothetical protein
VPEADQPQGTYRARGHGNADARGHSAAAAEARDADARETPGNERSWITAAVITTLAIQSVLQAEAAAEH